MDRAGFGQRDGNAVGWFLDRHLAEGRGDHTAFLDPHRSLTYAALAARRAPASLVGSTPPASGGNGAC